MFVSVNLVRSLKWRFVKDSRASDMLCLLSDSPAPRTNIQMTGDSSEGYQRLHMWPIQELEAQYAKFFPPPMAAQVTAVHLELPENHIITVRHTRVKNADA